MIKVPDKSRMNYKLEDSKSQDQSQTALSEIRRIPYTRVEAREVQSPPPIVKNPTFIDRDASNLKKPNIVIRTINSCNNVSAFVPMSPLCKDKKATIDLKECVIEQKVSQFSTKRGESIFKNTDNIKTKLLRTKTRRTKQSMKKKNKRELNSSHQNTPGAKLQRFLKHQAQKNEPLKDVYTNQKFIDEHFDFHHFDKVKLLKYMRMMSPSPSPLSTADFGSLNAEFNLGISK